jgi:TPP-dependent trihydroxycyclohexane-1,2-dione (THcHDO) dehydratase
MGFGLPSAIGAKVAAPEKIVVDIDGDASFSMTAMELATAAQYNIGVKVLVLQWQGSFPSFIFDLSLAYLDHVRADLPTSLFLSSLFLPSIRPLL